jgi:hypothetical protein
VDVQTQRRAQLIIMERIYQDAGLSAHQRRQQVIDVQQRITALQIDRGIDPQVLAAAQAEASARGTLATQAYRNTTEVRLHVV